MILRASIFMGGWIIGIKVLSDYAFSIISKAVDAPAATAFLVICLISIFTVVWGVIVKRS